MKKKLIITISVILALIILIPLALFGIPIIYNNIILLNVADDLRDAIKSTDGVELVELDKLCGNLVGNGNKMQFLAAAIVKCESEDTIKECLAETGKYSKDYARLRGKEITLRDLEHGKLDLDFTAYDYDDNMYVIYISCQPSYAAEFDVRAH